MSKPRAVEALRREFGSAFVPAQRARRTPSERSFFVSCSLLVTPFCFLGLPPFGAFSHRSTPIFYHSPYLAGFLRLSPIKLYTPNDLGCRLAACYPFGVPWGQS